MRASTEAHLGQHPPFGGGFCFVEVLNRYPCLSKGVQQLSFGWF
jgi:hypothetical protein